MLHALQAAEEDLAKWCGELTDEEIQQRPAGLPSVAFHLRHIPGSIDGLLTYAEGTRVVGRATRGNEAGGFRRDFGQRVATAHCRSDVQASAERVRRFDPAEFDEPRFVGRRRMPTTVGGLLVHVADHTQRHVGQAIATARLLLANRGPRQES